jgi:hypothetical protein
MFESESEAYATKHEAVKYSTLEWWSKRNAFKKGAELGYTKGINVVLSRLSELERMQIVSTLPNIKEATDESSI